jgi:gas vesicle protein
VDDVDLIIAAMEDASDDILQGHEENQETLYERIEKDLKDIQQAIYLSRTVPIVPLSSKTVELGDEPTQLQRIEDAIEARICQFKEEKEKATESLKKEKEEVLEKI